MTLVYEYEMDAQTCVMDVIRELVAELGTTATQRTYPVKHMALEVRESPRGLRVRFSVSLRVDE